MTTPLDIIEQALKDTGVLGVGQKPQPEDISDAFTKLNWMMGQWAKKRWLVFALKTTSIASTGAESYSIGTGGDFNQPRPDKIEAAFLRFLAGSGQNADYPLRLIFAREDYNRIALKSLTTWPNSLFYESAFPFGRLFFWPIPQAGGQYQLFITVKEPLYRFDTVNQVIQLPEEYLSALHFNLTVRLGPGYKKAVDPVIVALAKDSLNVLRQANTQVGLLRLPGSLPGPGGYNIYSDEGQ